MPLIKTYPAGLFYECAFNATAANAVPAWWTDLTSRTKFPSAITRGRQYELDTNPAGEWQTSLANTDGALDPSNTASPYAPAVVPYKPCRIRALPGVNLLTVDQATAGQGSMLPPGTSTAGGNALQVATGVTNDFGYTLSLVSSANAYTGSQVYQVTLPGGSTQFTTILIIPVVPIVQGRTYSASAQVLITSGSTVSCNVGLVFFDHSGNQLAAGPGNAQVITAGSASWTNLTVTTQAPGLSTPATYAYLKVWVNATIGADTTFQVGALQLERSASSTPFQVPQTVSPNLLPRAIATGTASIDTTTDSAANYFYPAAGSVAQGSFLNAAPTGQTSALAWTTPSGTGSSSPLYAGVAPASAASTVGPVADVTQVAGSTAYTGSVYLTRAASADATVQVTASFQWYDATGAAISASSGTAVTVPTGGTWVRATCTGTAPATAAWGRMRIAITSPGSTTATNVIYAASWQVEQNAAASTWMDPGPTYYIYTGLFERWPQSWMLNGTYGQADVVGVDAEAVLAQDTLNPPYIEELRALGPSFIYALADPAGSSTVVDSAGLCPPGTVTAGQYGPGSVTLGSSITSVGATGGFAGTPGPVAAFANTPSTNSQSAATYIALNPAATTPNYGLAFSPGTGSTAWTRMIAFNAGSSNPAHPMYLWSATMSTGLSPQPTEISFWIDTSGHLNITLVQSTTYTQTYSAQSYCDGNWHLVSAGVDNTTGTSLVFSLDGTVTTATASSSVNAAGMSRDTIGARIQDYQPSCTGGAAASIALAVQFPFVLTSAQITNLCGSWRTASAGESSGARANRVLTWAGWNGATAIDTGSTQAMGPASDLTGATALDALNSIALTESGNLFVSNSGAVTLTSRTRRYNTTNPQFTFGENTAVGEWPYEQVNLDFDPTHLFNDIQVTHYASSQVAQAIGVVSEGSYYQRVLQRTINPKLYTEAQDAASYLLQQYSNPRLRISNLTLHPAAMPGLFRVCLQLEIGTRIRVMRRPPSAPGAAPIQFDGFIEAVNWDIDPDTGDVLVRLQCSPADSSTYWTLAAAHTTLASPVTAGASQAVINALPDAALNPLAASMPGTCQLTFDAGTAIQETLTVAPPLPATNPGYSTATITFTTPFAYSHGTGADVCEALPTGYTDPTTWDIGSVTGASYTAFETAASAGASTITVGKLADARTNALSADWNVGDLLWLSPGTPGWEGYNRLHPNISTAGEGVLPLAAGTTGTALGLTGAAGTPTVTASASAYQGSKVWQTSVAANQSTPSGVLFVNKQNATAALPYTASIYTRSATTGANPSVYLYIEFLDANSNSLGSANGTTTALTGSPSATWTRLAATLTAPAGTVWVQIGVVLTGTAPSIAWSWQGDGLQIEQASSARAYQTCPQIQSVMTGVPGYTACTITLANPLGNNHAAGETVCEPLPAGTTVPGAVPASTRVAY